MSKNFLYYLIARFFNTVGMQTRFVVIGWQVYELTNSALDLGFVGLAQFLPAFLLALPAGQIADWLDRKKILIFASSLDLLGSAALLVLSSQGVVSTFHIYCVLVLLGSARAFGSPAGASILRDIVSEEFFPRAVALGSWNWQMASILGPVVGGILYASFKDPAKVYLWCTIFSAISTMAFVLLKHEHQVNHQKTFSLDSLTAGLRFVWKSKILLGATSLDLFAVLLGGATALLPIYARDVLMVGPSGLGWLRSAPGIGAAVVGLYLTFIPLKGKQGKKMFYALFIFGALTVVFATSKNFYLSMACLVLMGGFDLVNVVIRQTLVQIVTPKNMRGRVNAVNLVFISASNELGELESGLTAHWLGTISSAIVGGVGTCFVVIIWIYLFPALFKMDKPKAATEELPV